MGGGPKGPDGATNALPNRARFVIGKKNLAVVFLGRKTLKKQNKPPGGAAHGLGNFRGSLGHWATAGAGQGGGGGCVFWQFFFPGGPGAPNPTPKKKTRNKGVDGGAGGNKQELKTQLDPSFCCLFFGPGGGGEF